jgi:hypothetical protein
MVFHLFFFLKSWFIICKTIVKLCELRSIHSTKLDIYLSAIVCFSSNYISIKWTVTQSFLLFANKRTLIRLLYTCSFNYAVVQGRSQGCTPLREKMPGGSKGLKN